MMKDGTTTPHVHDSSLAMHNIFWFIEAWAKMIFHSLLINTCRQAAINYCHFGVVSVSSYFCLNGKWTHLLWQLTTQVIRYTKVYFCGRKTVQIKCESRFSQIPKYVTEILQLIGFCSIFIIPLLWLVFRNEQFKVLILWWKWSINILPVKPIVFLFTISILDTKCRN